MRGRAFAVVVAGLALAGCYSKITAHDGKMTLAYASGVQVENFVKPIAPGAKLDVVARTNGTEKPLTITKVVSSRPDVLAVDRVTSALFTLKAGAPGVADVEVSAKDEDGAVVTDRMFFHVAPPAVHRLEHACTEAKEAAYVREDFVDVFHNMMTSDRRPVIGYGYAPVRVEPAGALVLVAQPQGSALYRYRAPRTSARITLQSTVDQGALTVRIVDRGELTRATLNAPDRLVEGQAAYAVAHVEAGDVELCSQNALTKARSLTPTICRVTAKLEDEPGEQNREQLAEITALAFGVCEYELTLPELAGGRGVVLKGKTSIGKVRYPGDAALTRPWWTWLPPELVVGLGTLAFLGVRRLRRRQ